MNQKSSKLDILQQGILWKLRGKNIKSFFDCYLLFDKKHFDSYWES